ncbi:Ryanodine receptor 44F [Orchesella cincta]|uniref:Ryanodine receptor 44F n=1 Tax=Orchesella cincta TaxID=48709 RepID=A0A1D2N817_ORCCI|nr:Ryanodine receptor 44F [Orchesella cincta]
MVAVSKHAIHTNNVTLDSNEKKITNLLHKNVLFRRRIVRLVRLLIRQYDTFGEVIRALEKTYVFSCTTINHIHKMWRGLSRIRALLPVQMSQEEEALMRFLLWELVNNHIFFQHPDLIRILRVHENYSLKLKEPLPLVEGTEQPAKEKDTSHEMVVACCRFLCFFCRTSRQNQKAMFEHLGFLLENSNILLSRPSLRGSTPLDVAYSSLMENTELALALSNIMYLCNYLSESIYWRKLLCICLVPAYNPMESWSKRVILILAGIPFCVWVGGESVEENANLVIRLLIRRPECLGPNLRGEGDGLLRAIIDANKGKNESLRARAILRSLVPLEDLVGALSLRFSLQPLQRPGDPPKRDMPPGLVPNHKQSIVRFLERVYGVEERDLFMRLLEDAFLPDLRAATMLDRHDGGDSEMGLALNRYIGNSILPLLIKHSRFYGDADNYASLMDAALHTVYRLSKNKMLTKGQREAVSDFLVALTRELQPNMLLKLLRKLTVDVSKLSEYTTVALRLLTLHYERCSKYYGAGGQGAYGSASEEEKRLTMMLFSNIFESLAKMDYDPDLIQINADLNNLVIKFSEHWHDAWARRKLNNGWKYGEPYNWHERIHPRLKPYSKLTEYEKERYKEPIRDGIKALLAVNWTIEQGDVDMASRSSNTRRSSKADLTAPDTQTPFNYHPNPVDMTNMTLNREMQTMAERLAENLHDIWARKKKDEIDNHGGPPHPLVVPYDLLTDKEKRKDRDRMNELLKYVQYQGYRLYRLKIQGESEEDTSRAAAQSLERRFAYSLLEKLLHYLDVSSINLKSQVPSNNYSRRSTFKDTTRDVKFFTKVVLPLMEKYFNTHRTYFIAIATGGTASGAASLKEKEMVASLFCRLTTLLRSKLNSFGSDVKMTVRCLQVLIKAFDAKSITKSCPEFIRTSMLTFFNNAAEDLAHAIVNLQEKKYSHLRGTHLMTATSLNYVNSVLLPVLTSLFDHLAAYDYGADLILDDLQVASYKMLSSLYQLGTDMSLHKSRKYMKIELERYRPAIGSCLGAFASTFPIAFLEPALNKNNPNSVYHKLFEQSPQTAQDVMSRLGSNIPGLDAIIQEVENYVDAGKTYNEMPHIIDITLPMLCSYLPYWWSHGPDNATNVASDSHVSNVTAEHMNKLLKSVLNLIKTNIGNEQAMWMTRIAQFTQQIIINSAEELLTDPILPLAEKLRKKTEQMFHKEESVRGFLKSGTDDSSQIESQIQDEWQLLTRDIYAFYPLLIKYVDYQRNNWLKNNTLEAEHLYNHIAEIFNIWSKSQYFRREETNFISANEIDNMALIMPTSTRRTVMSDTSVQSGGKIKKKKKSRDKKRDKDKELASSLLVACLKRLLPVGLNLFAGREQELVQHCKDRYLKKMQDYEIVDYATTQLTLPDKIDPSDAMSWQHHLYSKLGAKRETSPEETTEKAAKQDKQDVNKEQQLQELVDRIVAMAKVLYGLHMIDHPQQQAKGAYRSVVTVGRKKAVIACFRQTALHFMPRHRAINLFLRTYKDMWLVDENIGQEVMIEHLTQTFEEAELKKKEEEEEEAKPDPLQQLVTTFTRGAMTERSGALQEDPLYMAYAEVMAKSCGEEEEEGGDEEEGEGPSIHEQEMEKQKLLFHQARLANRGVAEMVLLHISASKGAPSEMVMQTLGLGISILRGGNIDVQMQMLNHLKEKKDAGFFTSIAGLMNSCTVLDLDAFERNTKAEGLGVGPEGAAGEKNMHDAEFTCALFRFIQLTCEGHNLDWQNYLRTQAGNTTTVNVVICTVDYLLRLQESIMDFYWHYSSKELIDPAGKVNFFKAIGVASQVFNTLTEVIQGPCTQNQQALAHSRLWDAIGGFLFLFAHMQAKLSKNSSQVDLLKEMLNLQKDMVIMMLSMLEGNVVNGTIGKQMVDTLVESASNVEIILRYFDMFLKLKDLTSSSTFQEDMDKNKDGYVSPKEFKDSLEASKNYSAEEIDFLLLCCDTNHDGKIDYVEFTERFHNPAKEIGFNLAVLLTNLSEHMPNEPRLARFLETAGSVLNYFEPYLGRIEIMGSSKKIERVYFEILESNIEQWEKPQIKESKRAFFYAIEVIKRSFKPLGTLVKQAMTACKEGAQNLFSSLSPTNIKKKVHQIKQMTPVELIFGFFKMLFWVFYAGGALFGRMLKYVGSSLIVLMRGPPPEKKEEEKPADEFSAIKAPALPASAGPPEEEPGEGSVLAIMGSAEAAVEEGAVVQVAGGELVHVEGGGEESGERALVVRAASPVKEEKKEEKVEAPAAAASPLDEVEVHDEPSVASQIDFGSYFNGMVSFLARNFYNMKIVALVLAFTINFMLLFFKATALVEDEDEDVGDDLEGSGYEGSGLLDSGSGSGNGTLDEDGDEEEEDDEVPELVHMDEKFYYMAHLMRFLSVIHSIISLAMLFAYYHLKIPLAIFKREKEIARRLEFDGLYLAEQPEDDDLKAHWDRLVISAKSFPVNYWDKFVKKKVRQKYSETYDFDQISNLLGMEKTSFSVEEKADGGADWRYQAWKAGVTLTDNAFLYSLWYFCFSILGNFNYFFFAAHLLDVAVAVPALKTILQSVTHNGKQLVLTVMLLSIIVYIYTVIAFNFFRKFYVTEEDDEVDRKCHDMATCFVFHLYQGVRAGGGIGDVIEPPDGEPSEVYRIFFDITFFFFVIVILFFLMHLINKPDTEYTGQETYVWNMYQQRSWDFFPVGDCFRKQYEEELSGKSGGE